MGTLNPYRVPFLNGHWVIHTANTIGVNHFQLKLISEMFEMFVLLINEINSNRFCFVACFLFIFTREALPHRGLLNTIFCIAYLTICRGYLPSVFCIYKGVLFCICEQILFIWRQTFFICVQNFLICEIFFINSASSCYCRGSNGPT